MFALRFAIRRLGAETTNMSKGKGGGSRQSGDKASSTAGKVLAAGKATPSQAKTLAGSVLSQDPKKGPRGK